MRKTNFTVRYDEKTDKYDIVRFDFVYGSYTEQYLNQRGFRIKDGKLYEV